MTRKLTTPEVIALLEWAQLNHKKNWGGWANYPVSGCSYLQYEDNPLRVIFDHPVSYMGKTFNAVNWSRLAKGITFSELRGLIPAEDLLPFVGAPTYEFQHPNGNKFLLKQAGHKNYTAHEFYCTYPDGNQRTFTIKSGLYRQMLDCMPKGIEII